jgi:hypothetical protein
LNVPVMRAVTWRYTPQQSSRLAYASVSFRRTFLLQSTVKKYNKRPYVLVGTQPRTFASRIVKEHRQQIARRRPVLVRFGKIYRASKISDHCGTVNPRQTAASLLPSGSRMYAA